MDKKNTSFYLSILWLMIAVPLGLAWGFELIGGYTPCALCLKQRWGYYGALALLAIALMPFFIKISSAHKILIWVLLLCSGLLLWSAGLGVYHAGAEWGFWQGPLDCGGASTLPDITSDLFSAMNEVRLIACDEAALRVLGLSFAGWNVLSAGFLSIITLFFALKIRKKTA